MIKVHLIAAARPNFMKVAPLYHVLRKEPWCQVSIVHTGQHYDSNMSEAFFRDLRLPAPEFHLEVGSGTHAQQTGGVMMAYEEVALRERPDWIVVVGDVNSTLACALVGAKLWIPVAHLEAGLRSGDRRMPEEINRLATDAISDLLWTPSPDADENLCAEGISPRRIERIGNVMIDSFELMRAAIESDRTRDAYGLVPRRYAVVTLHRPSNVDSREALVRVVHALVRASRHLPLVFPVHPRTRKKLLDFGLEADLLSSGAITLTDPLGYVQFMNLVMHAAVVVTDSGGVQEETTYLGIPCLTLRENTERPITLTQGTNRLITTENLDTEVARAVETITIARRPDLWDGRAAVRAARSLRAHHEHATQRWRLKEASS
jgi:UDP-N-acetylglucosamine 2-epimerase (non-hydrolysing)